MIKIVRLPLIIVLVISLIFLYQVMIEEDEYHVHAAFHIYQEGKLIDLSGPEYMHAEPCRIDGQKQSDHYDEGAHLHNFIGDVIHIHREGVTWRDVFSDVGYEIDPTIKAFDGEKIEEGVLDREVTAYERIIFFDDDSLDLTGLYELVPTKETIIEVENTPESCGTES